MLKLPPLIGHRGAAGYAPENTIESIRTAADIGCRWVELDVKLTRDSVPILFHDGTLDRTTNGSGNVKDRDWEDIRQLEAGSWYADGFSGVRIPTLEEALEAVIELRLGLILDLSPSPGLEKETAEAALDILSRVWDDHDNLLISSMQPVSLETARDMAPEWKRSLVLWSEEMPEDWKALADYLDVSALSIDEELATREFIEDAIDLRKSVLVYTLNDPVRAKRLFSQGADSLFSDTPDILMDVVPKTH